MSYNHNAYKIYRGKCKEACEALQKVLPELRLVRGYYFDPIWNKEEPHWWLVDADGRITDPTKYQFPTAGQTSFYREFDGTIECANCGRSVLEEEASIEGNYAFCSSLCHGRFVGVL